MIYRRKKRERERKKELSVRNGAISSSVLLTKNLEHSRSVAYKVVMQDKWMSSYRRENRINVSSPPPPPHPSSFLSFLGPRHLRPLRPLFLLYELLKMVRKTVDYGDVSFIIIARLTRARTRSTFPPFRFPLNFLREPLLFPKLRPSDKRDSLGESSFSSFPFSDLSLPIILLSREALASRTNLKTKGRVKWEKKE